MCGKGQKSTTQTGRQTGFGVSAPNPVAAQAYQAALGQAGTAAAAPFQGFAPIPAAGQGQLVAPVNAQQTAGINTINQNTGLALPAYQTAQGNLATAAGMAQGAGQPIGSQQINQYLNPYTQQVVDATQRQFANMNAIQQQQVLGNAAAQGALGGDRVGVAQSVLAGQQAAQEDPIIAGLYSQGYQNAVNTALAEQNAQLAAAYGLGNIGVSGGQLGLATQQGMLNAGQSQIGAGTLQQQTQQALNQAQLQQYYLQQGYPFQTAQYLAGIAATVGPGLGGTQYTQSTGQQTTTQPQPSMLSQGLGLGVAGLGALGSMNAPGTPKTSASGGRVHGYQSGGSPSAYGVLPPWIAEGWIHPLQGRATLNVPTASPINFGSPPTDSQPSITDMAKLGKEYAGVGRGAGIATTKLSSLFGSAGDSGPGADVEAGLEPASGVGVISARGGRVPGFQEGGSTDEGWVPQEDGKQAYVIAPTPQPINFSQPKSDSGGITDILKAIPGLASVGSGISSLISSAPSWLAPIEAGALVMQRGGSVPTVAGFGLGSRPVGYQEGGSVGDDMQITTPSGVAVSPREVSERLTEPGFGGAILHGAGEPLVNMYKSAITGQEPMSKFWPAVAETELGFGLPVRGMSRAAQALPSIAEKGLGEFFPLVERGSRYLPSPMQGLGVASAVGALGAGAGSAEAEDIPLPPKPEFGPLEPPKDLGPINRQKWIQNESDSRRRSLEKWQDQVTQIQTENVKRAAAKKDAYEQAHAGLSPATQLGMAGGALAADLLIPWGARQVSAISNWGKIARANRLLDEFTNLSQKAQTKLQGAPTYAKQAEELLPQLKGYYEKETGPPSALEKRANLAANLALAPLPAETMLADPMYRLTTSDPGTKEREQALKDLADPSRYGLLPAGLAVTKVGKILPVARRTLDTGAIKGLLESRGMLPGAVTAAPRSNVMRLVPKTSGLAGGLGAGMALVPGETGRAELTPADIEEGVIPRYRGGVAAYQGGGDVPVIDATDLPPLVEGAGGAGFGAPYNGPISDTEDLRQQGIDMLKRGEGYRIPPAQSPAYTPTSGWNRVTAADDLVPLAYDEPDADAKARAARIAANPTAGVAPPPPKQQQSMLGKMFGFELPPNLNQALIAAGAAMASGRSPYPLQNIGAGITALQEWPAIQAKVKELQAHADMLSKQRDFMADPKHQGLTPAEWAMYQYHIGELDKPVAVRQVTDQFGRIHTIFGKRMPDGSVVDPITRKPIDPNNLGPLTTAGADDPRSPLLTDDEAYNLAKRRVASGNRLVLAEIPGYGTIGQTNRTLVQRQVQRVMKEQNISPEEMANRDAEWEGRKSAQRALGTMEAKMGTAGTELLGAVDLARKGIAQVSRTEFLPFNKLMEGYANNTLSPQQRALAVYTQGVRNSYAAVMNRGASITTVHAQQHADELLQSAFDANSYGSVLDAMEQEAERAFKSPERMREFYRKTYGGQSIETGVGVKPAPSKPPVEAPPVSMLKEGKYTTFGDRGTWTLQNGAPVRVQ